MANRVPLVVALQALLVPAAAGACPLCHTETGKQVREGIFGPRFGRNLLVTVAPFVAVSGLVPLASGLLAAPRRRGGRARRRRRLEKVQP